jgi:hypothetical protein
MKRPRRNRHLVVALYANAALLLAILLAVVGRGPSSSFLPMASGANAPQPIAGNGNLYIMPAQLLNNVWGCYLLDVENQTLCTYSFNGNQLLLKCARNIRYDHQLESYNTGPDPEEIRKLIELKKGKQAPETQPAEK